MSSESEMALAHAHRPCLCALQLYNNVGSNPRPRSSRGSRAGPIEISKILQNPRFSSFLPPQGPHSHLQPPWGKPLGSGSPPRGFHRISPEKYRIGTRSARKASRDVPSTVALAQGPYAGRRTGPGRSRGPRSPDPPNCDTLIPTMVGPTVEVSPIQASERITRRKDQDTNPIACGVTTSVHITVTLRSTAFRTGYWTANRPNL